MKISFIALLLALSCCSMAWAYVGPGIGITMLGSFWTIVLIFLAAFAGVLVWPVRRLYRWKKGPPDEKQGDDDNDN
jgi:membrane protein implicated in regulation of membrane protease activity